ncbi:MAG: polyprenyl synthetase family protein [Spirochaetia bacterium]|nr:polyprenyl synthetase family protein [Spirochaetia bacterium]
MHSLYEPALAKELEVVKQTIATTVSDAHSFIQGILRPHVQSGGKMLRPALVLLCSRLGQDSDRDKAIRVASVLEMIHLASLAHDDIIDSAKTRRGVPTLFAQRGAKQAVLAGDYLLARALALASGDDHNGETVNTRVVSNALSRLCESELEQDAGQGDYFISKTTYFRRIGGKTASLFALSCYAGAFVAESGTSLSLIPDTPNFLEKLYSTYFSKQSRANSLYVMAATTKDNTSKEPQYGSPIHGYFTQALLEGLGWDEQQQLLHTRNKYLDMDKLYHFVCEHQRIPTEGENPILYQHPTITGGAMSLVLDL